MPVRSFQATNLSDVIVLAGPNGVGKTRLLEWLIGFLRNLPSDPDNWIQVEATSQAEIKAWGKSALDTRVAGDSALLRNTLHQNRKRSGQRSSLLVFESNRTIAQVKPYGFTWDTTDPDEELVGWDFGFKFLRDRFTDTQHSIFRRIKSRRDKISFGVERLIREKEAVAETEKDKKKKVEFDYKDLPDPMLPFQTAFSQLLSPKTLLSPDISAQVLKFSDGNNQYPITELSSGEREVVNIVFDFILRNPEDCVVIFDEPELHLHPELSYKLIQTLRSVGRGNQFIFCTHSADIISSSLENSVIFVAPYDENRGNQAIVMKEDDDTNEALRLIGQSIGIVSLGRRIVLIEGESASLDKQTYGAILRSRFSNLVLAPSGGKDVIRSFSTLSNKVLEKTIWGVDFFMLCDRDAVPQVSFDELKVASKSKFALLGRYHLENYFLDSGVIAEIFSDWEAETSWLRDPVQVEARLASIAKEQIPYAAALIVSRTLRERAGNVSLMPKGVQGMGECELANAIISRAKEELARLNGLLLENEISNLVAATFGKLNHSIEDLSWKTEIPGKVILRKFCAEADIDFGRFKMAYINVVRSKELNTFAEIEAIFEGFSTYR
jgi:energy-coupling factor transporter ATP-binding protein EcfA2